MNMNSKPSPEERAAASRRYEETVQRGARLIRRRRLLTGAALGVAVVAVVLGVSLPLALSGGQHPRTKVNVVSPVTQTSDTTTSWAPAPTEGSTAAPQISQPTTRQPQPTRTTQLTLTTPPTTRARPTTTTGLTTTTQPTPTTQPDPPPVGPGTASLTYSGVLSGPLTNAVSYCYSRLNSGAESEIDVRGMLNGTPWVLFVQSYDGQTGVWQVLTGQGGGGTGMTGQGYAVTANYPATVGGATQVDWSKGATLDVQLTSRSGQTPAGNVAIQGTISC